MVKKDLIAYTILAASALYGINALAQRKMEFCEPPSSNHAQLEVIASGKLGDNGATYQSYRSDANTILTFIYKNTNKGSIELVGYTRSTKIPLDPAKPNSTDYRTDSLGCIKVANKFRKAPISEVADKLSR